MLQSTQNAVSVRILDEHRSSPRKRPRERHGVGVYGAEPDSSQQLLKRGGVRPVTKPSEIVALLHVFVAQGFREKLESCGSLAKAVSCIAVGVSRCHGQARRAAVGE